jgi:hypothetical protein
MSVIVAQASCGSKANQLTVYPFIHQALLELIMRIGKGIHLAQDFRPLIAFCQTRVLQGIGIELPENALSRFGTAK